MEQNFGNMEKKEEVKTGETKVIVVSPKSNAVGICALIFSILSVFLFAIVFMPIGLILSIIALIKKQYVWGACALIICIFSIWTSPTLWDLIAGLCLF